jgi:hypothetical protein
MKRVTSFLVMVGIALGLAVTTEAQSRSCGVRRASINRRQDRQHDRIRHNVRSGELTRSEAWRLRNEQFAVRREEWRYRRDGHLTPRERAELQRELNQASRHIYGATHNRRDRN